MQISGDSSLQTSGPSLKYTQFIQIKTFLLISPYCRLLFCYLICGFWIPASLKASQRFSSSGRCP